MNAHVRVDLVYGAVSERARTWIDLLGGLFFLAPLCILLIYFTWGWAWTSFVTQEASANAGGLPAGMKPAVITGGHLVLESVDADTAITINSSSSDHPLRPHAVVDWAARAGEFFIVASHPLAPRNAMCDSRKRQAAR